MSSVLSQLLGTPAVAATPASTPASSTDADINKNEMLGLTISITRVAGIMGENNVNKEYADGIRALDAKIALLPGHAKRAQAIKELAAYKKEKKEQHPQYNEVMKALDAEVANDKQSAEYLAIVEQKKALSKSKKKTISDRARITAATIAEFAADECVNLVMSKVVSGNNVKGCRLSLGDLLDGCDQFTTYPLFRDGVHYRKTVAKHQKDEEERKEHEKKLVEANANNKNAPRNINSQEMSKDKAPEQEQAPQDSDDNGDNYTPAYILTYTNQIIKKHQTAFTEAQKAKGVTLSDKFITFESSLRMAIAEITFDVIDGVGMAIESRYQLITKGTLTDSQVDLIIATVLSIGRTNQDKSDELFKRIEDVRKKHSDWSKARKDRADSKLTEEKKAEILKKKAERAAAAAAINEIAAKYTAAKKDEIAKYKEKNGLVAAPAVAAVAK